MIARLSAILANPLTERVVIGLILVNAITLGMETSKAVMEAYGDIILVIDKLILAVFVAEITARILVHRSAFFRDPWSIFDLIVVAIALIPATGSLSVLRALRVLRVLRLITVLPSLRRVVQGLLTALPGMGSITLLLGIIFYVFAVMGTKLFGEAFPKYFGTLADSVFTLFQVMTLEGWSENVVRPIMEQYPQAWLFFVPYIVVTTFMVLNLFIGVVVSAMQKEADAQSAEAAKERDLARDEAILQELRILRAEVTALRQERSASPG
ncbi:MAG: ion transporter [Alphaproteobacteria bacterium]|jgi:voltage-gated sodium channel